MSSTTPRDEKPRPASIAEMDDEKENNKIPVTTPNFPSQRKQIFIMAALYLTMFLTTLDQNIISTAIPKITDEFNSLDDIAWYGTAYLLTMCSFQLLMGKIYKFYPAKPVFLIGTSIFEIGSAVCGSAPSSRAFIAGRAISGLGAAGMYSGIMVIMFHTIPLQLRPIYQGAFGAIFAVASVVGPLLGGTFTDKVTWRWCFYINLPVGAISLIVTFFILHLPNQKLDPSASDWVEKLKQLDPLGNLVFFPGIVCLVLALQWGGTEYSWSSPRIIILLVLCGVLCLAFIAVQIWKGESGTLPPRLLKQRSIAACVWVSFFNGAGMITLMYYQPIWFQAIKGVSAVKSGIMLLPMMLSTVATSLSSGFIISKVGYYTPFFIISSAITPIGAGLFATFTPNTSHAQWIGYQVLYGIGLGFGTQQPLMVVQTILSRSDISTGSAFVMFMRFMGSAIFLAVAQNVFLNKLVSKVTANLPGIGASAITSSGATDLRNLASGLDLETLLWDYNTAIVNVFYMVAATSAATMLGSVLVEWRSLKTAAKVQEGEKSKVVGAKEKKDSV